MPQIIERGDRFGVRIHIGHGQRKWVGTKATYEEAWQAGLDAEEEARINPPIPGEMTWGEFAGEVWIRDYNHLRKDGSLRWSERHAQNLGYALKAFTERWGSVPMSKFPDGEALAWIGQRPRSELAAVRTLFNDARKAGLCKTNPFEKLGLEESKGRAGIVPLTEEEVRMLADLGRAKCGEWMEALLLWQSYTGCRPMVTFNIRPEDFHPAEGSVYLRGPGLKRHSTREVIVPPVACEAAARLPIGINQRWLFVSPRGRKLSTTTVTHHWNKVRSAFETKLDPRRSQELRDARADRGEIDFYELRHFAATMLLDRGASYEDVAWQLASGRDEIEGTYGHPSDEARRKRLHGTFQAPVPASLREAASNG